jgi:hypothetical protein
MAHGSIKGHESTYAANNFKARTITQNQNSTVMHQEIISIGGTQSTLAVAAVVDSTPASTEYGMVVRPTGGSTVVSLGGVSQTMQFAASTNPFGASTLFAINSTVTGQKCKVYAYSITTTNAGPLELCFYKGSTMAWPIQLAAVSPGISGANLAVTPPGFLFETAAGSSMTLRCNSTASGVKVGVAFYVAS